MLRDDKLLQYATLDVDGKRYKLEQVDNYSRMYLRIGITQRPAAASYPNKAFFFMPNDIVDIIKLSPKPISLTLDLQYKKGIRLEMSAKQLQEFKTLTTLNRSHYTTYLEPVKK